MKTRANMPMPRFDGILWSEYTYTRSIPLLGEPFLKMKPKELSSSSPRTLRERQYLIYSV